MNNRAYAWLSVREVDDDKRIIEGIATTPVQARDGDILETSGISFKLPIPFLYRHKEPMGNVTSAKVTKDGITVRVQIGPPGISQALDEAWNMVKAGLVRGLSIGWRTIAEMYDKDIDGYRIMKSEWLELSAVPVPADPGAMISSIRSADEESGIRAMSFENLPFVARDAAWEPALVLINLRKWASSDGSGDQDKIDWAKYRKAFFWHDSSVVGSFDSYKLPYAIATNGELKAVSRGIEAAAASIADVNIPDSEREMVKNHVARYYSKMASMFNDDTIIAPWNKKAAPDPASGKPGGKNQKPGVAGKSTKRDKTVKTFDTQIQEFTTELTDVRQQMTDLMENSEDGILKGDEAKQYDELTERSAELRANIKRLQAHKENSEEATPTPAPTVVPPTRQAPAQPRVEVKPAEKDPEKKGIGVARMVIALVQARGNHYQAADLARQHYRDMPEVALALRAAVDAGDTTTSGWASQLVPAAQQMQGEFIDMLRPATLIGRIPGLRRVPFNIAVPLQSGGGTYGWVGEAKPKPVTSAAFQSATLRWAKAAGIVVITRELARFSSPSAETIIRNELIRGTAQFLDGQFIDDAVAATNDNPASILNGIVGGAPSGTTAEAFRYDLSVLVGAFIAANQDPTSAVLLMSATTAMNLALMRNALGNREFPDITVRGGSVDGIPAVVSETVGTRLALINANDILVADDGVINIDVSEQASVEMSTTPVSGEESPIDGQVFKSLWQNNLVGLRVETFMTWRRARTSSVAWLDAVAYAPSQPTSPA